MGLQDQVIAWLAQQEFDIYLVGGCVRDPLLGREVHDLDVVVDGDGLSLARRLADRFQGDFYPLDDVRRTGRSILRGSVAASPLVVDIAQFRGPDLASDLADRDFTVNALAVDVRSPGVIIDHHGGLTDLSQALIRPVAPDSIRNDPLRALRAVRLAAQLDFALAADTVGAILRDGEGLVQIPGERVRDELVHLLLLPAVSPSLKKMEELGLLFLFLPEMEPLQGLTQTAPHHLDVLQHSLETVHALETILGGLDPERDQGQSVGGSSLGGLQRYAGRIRAHLSMSLSADRPRAVALKLAALLHDTGKPAAFEVDSEGRRRFFGHEKISAQIATLALRRLCFSGAEVRVAERVIRHHMRPLLLAEQTEVTRRAVYRFFRATGEDGVDVILHALADHRATYAPGTGNRTWSRLLSVAVRMLGDFWEYQSERVSPPRLVNGHDLRLEFGLQPGPQIGDLLEAVREAQATDEIHTREEAIVLVRSLLSTSEGGQRQ